MEDVGDNEKLRIASEFLLHSPPGEFNDVFNDIRVLIHNDALLQQGVAGAFQQYNTTQFTPVDMPGQSYKVLISQHGQIDATHYLDPRSNQVFAFDHMRQVASDPQPATGGPDSNRTMVDDAFKSYVSEHYPAGVSTVYNTGGGVITAVLVDNKYSPRNFWNGRWRSVWVIKISGNTATLNGTLMTQVHYYEDGNVQLNSEKSVEITATGPGFAASITSAVKKAESEYQTALNESYAQLSDTTFKALRRNLPITRNKLDWNKILSYKIGGELSQK